MASDLTLWAELEQTFLKDIPVTSKLLELLQQERTALETRKYDSFQQIISQKQQMLTQLELHASMRQQLLQQAGYTDETAVLTKLDTQAPIVAKAWRKLGEQWGQCKELNEINERIAQRTRLVVGQTLDLLRGQNTQAKLYTKKGDALNQGNGRTITNA